MSNSVKLLNTKQTNTDSCKTNGHLRLFKGEKNCQDIKF